MWVAKSAGCTPRPAGPINAPALTATPNTFFARSFIVRFPQLLEVRGTSRLGYPPRAGRTHAISAAPAAPCRPAAEPTSTLRQPACRQPADAAPAARKRAHRGLGRSVDR